MSGGTKRTLRVLVVDDEPIARRRVLRMLERLEDVEVAGEAVDGPDALEKIHALAPDVVLLDIRMPGLDGLTLARTVPQLPPVIFTTAYDEYAVEAFETAAVAYLMKPISRDRLAGALERAREGTRVPVEGLERLLHRLTGDRDGRPLRVTARLGDTIRVFDPAAIGRFRAADKYTVLEFEGAEYLLDESLASLEKRLESLGLLRVHRRELINLHHVRALRLEDGTTVAELDDGSRVAVSRRLSGKLKRRLGAG